MKKIALSCFLFFLVFLLWGCQPRPIEPVLPPTPPSLQPDLVIPTKTAQFEANATYYVTLDGVDTLTSGSYITPFQSVNYALKNLPSEGGWELLVADGDYDAFGYISKLVFSQPVLIRAIHPLQVRVMNQNGNRAMYLTACENIIFSGFEFVGNPVITTGDYLLQIETCLNIVLENNVIHDSYRNDLLKLNEHSSHCEIRNNIFYNPNSGGDEHIDANSVYDTTIEGNLFFNDYLASGRPEQNTTYAYILFKSSSSTDLSTASHDALIRQNIFFNWWGKSDQSYISLGEDNKSFPEMRHTQITQNLFLNNPTRTTASGDGNFVNRLSGLISIKNAQDTLISENISNGFIQHSWHAYNATHDGFFGYLLRLDRTSNSPQIEGIQILNNILSDHSGKMGYLSSGTKDMVKDTKVQGNTFYNGGVDVLHTPLQDVAIRYEDDLEAYFNDPGLETNLATLVTPVLENHQIRGGSTEIEAIRQHLVLTYGTSKIKENGLYASLSRGSLMLTNQDVVVQIITNQPILDPLGWTKIDSVTYTKVYSTNVTESFDLTTEAGQSYNLSFQISNIDKIAPIIYLVYEKSAGRTIVIATANEAIDWPDGWQALDSVTRQKEYSMDTIEHVRFRDLAGNAVDFEVNTTLTSNPTAPWRTTALVFIVLFVLAITPYLVYFLWRNLQKKDQGNNPKSN